MPLREQLNDDIKDAMKARATDKLNALRLMLSAVKQREVDERITLDDPAVVSIVDRLCKQRKDSIEQFTAGGRQDLVDKEQAELGRDAHVVGKALHCDTHLRLPYRAARAVFTAADTRPMSARPEKRGLAAAITLPMSPGPAAPVSATTAATSAAMASALRRGGR